MAPVKKRVGLTLVAGIAALTLAAVPALPRAGAVTTRALGASLPLLSPGDHRESLQWGGMTRMYIVHVPPGRAVKNRPLILVYHGATDTDTITIATTDFEQVADRTGDIVAFLQGYSNTWDELAGHTPAAQHHIDDIGYTEAVLAALSPLVGYNTSRVAVTGLSNGALMVETLGCRLASKIRLIVPVEGELASAVSPSCAPSRPINVLEIHGTADPSIPYNGGVFIGVGGAVSVLSARATVARWAHLDRCATGPVTTPGRGITLTRFTRCHSGVSVTLRTIVGGVHVWGSNIGELVTVALGH